MTDYFWPLHIVPNASSWSLVANTAAFTSPISGTTRTISRGGDRWRCSLTFNNLTTDKRALLQAFLSQLRGQANRVWVKDHSYRKRGSFPTRNLLPDFSLASSWTESYSTLVVADRVGRVTAAAHTGAQLPCIQAAPAVSNGYNYALRAFFTRSSTGTASMGPYFSAGTPAASYSTTAGMKTVTAVSSGTSSSVVLFIDSTGSSTATGDYVDIAYASLARSIYVNGASQTGSKLNVATGSYASTNGVLLAGDRVEFNGEYHVLIEPMNTSSGGNATLHLARPMRSSPATLSAVHVHDPMCKMILADNTVSWSNSPGGFSSMSVDLIEDIAS